MVFLMHMPGIHLREQRLIHLFKEVGPNLRTLGEDIKSTYITGPLQKKDPIQIGMAAPLVIASAIADGFDAAYAGIADQKIDAPDGGLGGRTRRDLKEIMKNHIRHPIHTLLSGLRLISDIPMDTLDIVGGFRHGARSRMQRLLTPYR
jgi:hypothetical protein